MPLRPPAAAADGDYSLAVDGTLLRFQLALDFRTLLYILAVYTSKKDLSAVSVALAEA